MYFSPEIDGFRESLLPPMITLGPGYDYHVLGEIDSVTSRDTSLLGLVPVSTVMLLPKKKILDPECNMVMDIHTVLGEKATVEHDAFVLAALLGKSATMAANVHGQAVVTSPSVLDTDSTLSASDLFELKMPIAVMAGWACSRELYDSVRTVTLTYNKGVGLGRSLDIVLQYIEGALNAIKKNWQSYAMPAPTTGDFDGRIGLGDATISPEINTSIAVTREKDMMKI